MNAKLLLFAAGLFVAVAMVQANEEMKAKMEAFKACWKKDAAKYMKDCMGEAMAGGKKPTTDEEKKEGCKKMAICSLTKEGVIADGKVDHAKLVTYVETVGQDAKKAELKTAAETCKNEDPEKCVTCFITEQEKICKAA